MSPIIEETPVIEEPKKSKHTTIDFLSAIIVGVALCLAFWVYDAKKIPAKASIISYWIEDDELLNNSRIKTPETKYVAGDKVKINPGDTIHITYFVERFKTGEVINERIFFDGNIPDNREHQISSMSRKIDSTRLGKQFVETEFKVPLNVRLGCNAAVYSKNYYTYHLNPLTMIKNTLMITDKMHLCIEKEVLGGKDNKPIN